jgi:hypothetical protein
LENKNKIKENEKKWDEKENIGGEVKGYIGY